MKKLFVFLICLSAIQLTGQDHVLNVWGEVMNPDSSETVTHRGIKWITNVQNPILEVFLPAENQSTGQAVMICPGGGYTGLAYDWEGTDIAKWLNGHGIAGIVLKYRLPNAKKGNDRWKDPIMDAQKGLQIINEMAEEWHVNKGSIGIMGFSAGGHLAAFSSNPSKDIFDQIDEIDNFITPDFSILMYPVISMQMGTTHGGSKSNLIGNDASAALSKTFSNEHRVTENSPPALLIHSADDEAVPVENSIQYYQALKDDNVDVEMHLFPKGGHGYALAIDGGQESQWPALCIAWLKNLNKTDTE